MAPDPIQKTYNGLSPRRQPEAEYVSSMKQCTEYVDLNAIHWNRELITSLITVQQIADKRPWFLKGDPLTAPYPNYVIGSGAKTLPGLLQVSRMSGRASFSGMICVYSSIHVRVLYLRSE